MSLEGVEGLRVLGFSDHLPFASSGGSERVAWEVYRRLAAAGAAVTLVAATDGPASGGDIVEGVRLVTVPAVRLRRWLRAEVSVARGLSRAARAEVQRGADVLHANSLHFQSSMTAAALASRTGMPLVTTVHLAAVEMLPTPLRLATSAYERTAGRLILRRSTCAIAVSPSVATHVRALGMPASRVVVVPNGVDHDTFSPAGRVPRAVPHVVMVGRLIANKGPAQFVEALAALRDEGVPSTAALVGDGPLRAGLEKRVRELELSDRVTFTGYVTDVASALRGADVLARPSLTEGMPLAVLEAMASGVCVVASAVPGTTDVVVDGENGLLFPPGSRPDFVAVLRRVLTDDAERSRLAAAGHETSLRYSWDATAAGAARVLADAVRQAASPA